ncbi:DUF4350 domain-containing protein [Brachybacterium sp. YJGR34]|uniref:DUF4350 domain-containing protein n=1 Tax=Brachybacterium sp. YJGR34 TaxID=2059911 RepID=UPI000E0A51C0|nr:DUF4350 domain-containing protein [Brachybacterium sp. YJGR34]
MSAALAPSAQVPGSAPTPAPAPRRRRHWLTVLVVLAMLATVVVSVFRSFYQDGPLEPGAPTGQGSKAVVQVLEDLGVDVQVQRHTADAAQSLREGRTVLVTDPTVLQGEQLDALVAAHEAEGSGRLVLVQPDFVTLSYFSSRLTPGATLDEATTLEASPGCGDLAHGARALAVPGEEGLHGRSVLYRPVEGADGCFTVDGGSLVAEDDGLLVLGSADLLTNDGVGAADNSALVLNALGGGGELAWYVPSATDPMGTAPQSIVTYLPDWAAPLGLWLMLVAGIALLALGRRFGPVVLEPLPVTVRPQEIALGRARLLQRAGDRDAAATALRSAAATRLADALGLRHERSLDGLVAALAEHVDHSPEQLRALLGPTPVTSDQDLVRLAHDLDRLEKEIDR